MYDLVIIGAGPAGISMAAEARRSGISEDKIVILEKSEEHSYSIRKFYPDQKLVTANYKGQAALCKGVMCLTDTSKHETLSLLDQAIESYKINVHYKETVYKIQKQTALAYLSAATTFEVSQVVDKTKGVHSLIKKSDFEN